MPCSAAAAAKSLQSWASQRVTCEDQHVSRVLGTEFHDEPTAHGTSVSLVDALRIVLQGCRLSPGRLPRWSSPQGKDLQVSCNPHPAKR